MEIKINRKELVMIRLFCYYEIGQMEKMFDKLSKKELTKTTIHSLGSLSNKIRTAQNIIAKLSKNGVYRKWGK